VQVSTVSDEVFLSHFWIDNQDFTLTAAITVWQQYTVS